MLESLEFTELSARIVGDPGAAAPVTRLAVSLTPSIRPTADGVVQCTLRGYTADPSSGGEEVYEALATCVVRSSEELFAEDLPQPDHGRFVSEFWPHVRQILIDQVGRLGFHPPLPLTLEDRLGDPENV